MDDVTKVEVTKAKSGFAQLPGKARRGDVAITRHGRTQFYVVTPERYDTLTAVAGVGKGALQVLEEQFDSLIARMQQPTHAKAIDGLVTRPLGEILAQGAMKGAGPKVVSSRARSESRKLTRT